MPCSRNAEQITAFGTSTSIRYAHDLKDGVHNYLIVIHTYTGCDTVSAFAGRGKLGAVKLTRSGALSGHVSRSRAVLGTIRGPTQEAASIHTQNVHIIHDNSGHQHSPPPAFLRTAWGARVNPACTVRWLPLHAYHGIWRCSLQQHPQVPSPVKRGWVRNDDGQLTLQWMRGYPAPEAVLQQLLYKCSRICKLPESQYMSNGLK